MLVYCFYFLPSLDRQPKIEKLSSHCILNDIRHLEVRPHVFPFYFEWYQVFWKTDGWVMVLHPFQQYFSHFDMMEGWTWKALCNEALFRFGKNLASSRIRTRDPQSRVFWKISDTLRHHVFLGILKDIRHLDTACLPRYSERYQSWLVVLRLNVPVNNFSVMSGRSHRFLGN